MCNNVLFVIIAHNTFIVIKAAFTLDNFDFDGIFIGPIRNCNGGGAGCQRLNGTVTRYRCHRFVAGGPAELILARIGDVYRVAVTGLQSQCARISHQGVVNHTIGIGFTKNVIKVTAGIFRFINNQHGIGAVIKGYHIVVARGHNRHIVPFALLLVTKHEVFGVNFSCRNTAIANL